MSIAEYLKLILNVLKDWRVIVTVVVVVLIIEFAKFITTYRKKPAVPKPKKAKAAPETVEKPAEEPKDRPPDMSENDAV